MCALEATETGLPMMRAMHWSSPDEPAIEGIEDQYMLGPSLLVAPILNESQQERWVYFPSGTWYPWGGGGSIIGPCYVMVPAPLGILPLFIRDDAVIPRFIHKPQHLKEDPAKIIGLDIFPNATDTIVRFRNMSIAR